MSNVIVINPRPFEIIAEYELWRESLDHTPTHDEVIAYCERRRADEFYAQLLIYVHARQRMTYRTAAARN